MSMIISWLLLPQAPPLTCGGAVIKESDDRDILEVKVDRKFIFEKYLRCWFAEQLLKVSGSWERSGKY